jgi:hypothetical protein
VLVGNHCVDAKIKKKTQKKKVEETIKEHDSAQVEGNLVLNLSFSQ